MLFYIQMKWNYQNRISQDQLWALEAQEGEHAIAGLRSGMVKCLYKVVSQHRVIAIVDVDSLEDLDRNSMGWLPMREFLEFEQVWALRDYEGFIEDVKNKFPPPGATLVRPLPATHRETEQVARRWFDALGKGDAATALSCLADDVVWINNPGIQGLSDVIPWLGEYHGREAVAGTFVIWGKTSEVKKFELVKLTIDAPEAFAVVHEIGLIKATGKEYDIEFIQRFTVDAGHISRWRSYWDTARAIAAFRAE